jgi:hypothetical protein
MGIECHIRGVHSAIGKPALNAIVVFAKHGLRKGKPIELFGLCLPKSLGITASPIRVVLITGFVHKRLLIARYQRAMS